MTEPKTEKEKFLCDEFQMFSWNGAVQRGGVYIENLAQDSPQKVAFRKKLTKSWNEMLCMYQNKEILEEEHFNNIEKLAECFKSHKCILREPYYKIGIAQKLLNLRLKYLWCIGKICRPPHCPIDRRILNKVRWKCDPWTKWDCIDQYKAAIELIEKSSGSKHIADWELWFFNNK